MSADAALNREAASVFQAHYGELVGMLTRILDDPEQARDVAQEAGMRLITRIDIEVAENPKALLFRVAVNLARDQLRHRMVVRRAEAEIALEGVPVSPATEDVHSDREQLALLAVAIRALPEQPRRVFALARLKGLSQQEIAAELGISRKTVENHLTRALARLAEALGRERVRHRH